ncbi:hypothetical protein [Longitalea arenae]|uniref:hypothetical protein n=1 Tax=Longitalea arenae TaxID=2812558 RepID=UPI001967AA71|nr:hypothetical protein [Longitalea arenae]
MVRFTAIWYPVISIGIIVFTHLPNKIKWLGVGCITCYILAFIGRTQYEYKIRTNTIQYAAFGGWQIAANALYGYANARPIDPENVPHPFRMLHSLVNHHMDSLSKLTVRPDEEIGVYYQWDFSSPLRVYNKEQWKNDKNTPFFIQWASMAPFYASYGRWLITKYPWPFIRHYVWPNLIRYYVPPSYFMGRYNIGNRNVDAIVVSWFKWQNDQLPTRTKDRNIRTMDIFPNLLAIINPVFLLCSLIFIGSAGLKKCNPTSKRVITCMLLIWFTNTIFSILSAPIELRYQIFPIAVTLPFGSFLFSWIIQSLKTVSKSKESQSIHIPEPVIKTN